MIEHRGKVCCSCAGMMCCMSVIQQNEVNRTAIVPIVFAYKWLVVRDAQAFSERSEGPEIHPELVLYLVQ